MCVWRYHRQVGPGVAHCGRARAAACTGRNIFETSLVGSAGSNGVVVGAILSVEKQLRMMKDALEHRWAVKLPAAQQFLPRLMEYVGVAPQSM